VFFLADVRRKPTFTYELDGEFVTLKADPGAGIMTATSKIAWDLDNDGSPDPDPVNQNKFRDDPVLKLRAGDISSDVTLFIDDPITRKRISVTRTIEFPAPPAPQATEGAK
jgi:hypothetical protein